MNYENIDLLIAGAGPVGCVTAERMATLYGWRCLVVDKRNHIAGNCYDYLDESGLLLHKYGPHYFRTDNVEIINYLSAYTAWIPGNYIVKNKTGDELYPFPINLETLQKFFNRPDLTAETAWQLLEEKREKIDHPKNSEEFVLSRVGRELYEAFYVGYAQKQWGLHPADMDIALFGRIPIRFDGEDRNATQKFKLMPADGYSRMFEKMLNNPLIEVELGVDFFEAKNSVKPAKAIVYTGRPDEYYNYMLGPLPWQTIQYEFKEFDEEFVQPCVQVNYPNGQGYNRTVEIKHVTRQKHPKTVVGYEYPRESGDVDYPVPSFEGLALYEKYRQLATHETFINKVYFAGMQARYTYMDIDEAITSALQLADKLAADFTLQKQPL